MFECSGLLPCGGNHVRVRVGHLKTAIVLWSCRATTHLPVPYAVLPESTTHRLACFPDTHSSRRMMDDGVYARRLGDLACSTRLVEEHTTAPTPIDICGNPQKLNSF